MIYWPCVLSFRSTEILLKLLSIVMQLLGHDLASRPGFHTYICRPGSDSAITTRAVAMRYVMFNHLQSGLVSFSPKI
jgi:hypothetical protein